MKLRLSTDGVKFRVARVFEPRTDKDGVQRRDKQGGTNLPLWSVQLTALDDLGGETIYVTVAMENPPALTPDQPVTVEGLEAMPWVQDSKPKVAFRATAVSPVSNVKSAPAA